MPITKTTGLQTCSKTRQGSRSSETQQRNKPQLGPRRTNTLNIYLTVSFRIAFRFRDATVDGKAMCIFVEQLYKMEKQIISEHV